MERRLVLKTRSRVTVRGSSPPLSANNGSVEWKHQQHQRCKSFAPAHIRGCSSVGRASALQAECRRFDPCHFHHIAGVAQGQSNTLPTCRSWVRIPLSAPKWLYGIVVITLGCLPGNWGSIPHRVANNAGLAQWQSISFTPRRSGVRISHPVP